MTRLPVVTVLVVGVHWMVAIWHLFLAAEVLPPPNNGVSWLAIALITSGHLIVFLGLWKLSHRLGGLVALVFFLAALSADLYEHFLHASLNNVFMVAPGGWTGWFDASVLMLLLLEVLGCFLGGFSLGSAKRRPSAAGMRSGPAKQSHNKLSPRRSNKLVQASI